MHSPRHDPVPAFVVGVIAIALFSGMDAVMKGLVLSIGMHMAGYNSNTWQTYIEQMQQNR